MVRYCANCGTEVDESAIFCPTCGQPIDQATEAEIPAAPAWPEAPASSPADSGWERETEPEPDAGRPAPPPPADAPTQAEARAVTPPPAAVPPPRAVPPPPAEPNRGQPAMPNIPITMPVTLSAWLIGIGSVIGALGVLIGLFDVILNPIELLLLLALLAIAASVFFSGSLPEIPNLRLGTLAIVLIGFGIALDRIGFGGAGVGDLLIFLGTAAAAIGAIILELGHDQPMGPSR